MVNTQHSLSIAQGVGCLFLFFISFLKPPVALSDGFIDFWRTYVPFVHLLVMLGIFLVIPLWVGIQTWVNIDLISQSNFGNSILLYPFSMLILLILWVPFEVKGYFDLGLFKYR